MNFPSFCDTYLMKHKKKNHLRRTSIYIFVPLILFVISFEKKIRLRRSLHVIEYNKIKYY